MKTNHHFSMKSAISILLILAILLGIAPMSIFAAQTSDYVDPADHWLKANGRTNELDVNASTTYETQWCAVCDKDTTTLTYRVPEYTKSGETALNRGVKFSDGTLIDGEGTGNLDDGTPGVDAFYTGYHFTKAVCQICGTINATEGPGYYSFNKNVYALNSCDHNFFIDFDNTTYEPDNDTYHTSTLKKGEYCKFCKGTYARASEKRELHDFTESIDGQLGNSRFYVSEECDECGYQTSEYLAAKAVVSSYYGTADGEPHSITVTDLSDNGVKTSIRYGTEADQCNKTSAPSYTQPGYHSVYYEIDYSYGGEEMTENGVSYVWLLEENTDGGKDDSGAAAPHAHDYRYVETVLPTCDNLGFEYWQCDGCGRLEKRNYTPAAGHSYKEVIIREATCKQGGLKLVMCSKCGDFHEETTPTAEHKYKTELHNPTCWEVGYTNHICEVCGDNYITDIMPLIAHSFERVTKQPTCTEQGYTTSTCTMCGYNYVSDYTDPTGHNWDEGHIIANPTCDSDGVMEFHCKNCDETMMKGESAMGHTPGKPATCIEPQVCEKCGTVLELPKGHHYESTSISPTCTSMGYTVFECSNCGDTYTGEFTDKAEHSYTATVTESTCTEMGFTTYVCEICGDTYKDNYTDKIPHSYETAITAPTCVDIGFTTYTCSACGESYCDDYVNALGHKPSEWMIDVPATIEHSGEKHMECTACGKVLMTSEIPQLVDTDHSDEDGNAEVGAFSLILTDKDGKPIFDSEISIDINDNVTIKLPSGRLLDYANQTTITVIYTDTQEPKSDLHIFIYDEKNNAATGKTDVNGQLKVPNHQSSTGDDNGTIGKDDGEGKGTFVIRVTDKTNTVISNCEVHIGESNNIVVDLPDGVKPTREAPVIITVTDQNGNAKEGVTVITLGDTDYVEKGVTDIYGKVTLPITNEGYTDEDGKVNVNGINVIVNDEVGFIPNAHVIHNEDGTIAVTLPEDKTISHANRITVTVLDSMGNPIKDVPVTVKDLEEKTYSANTDENGKVTAPPTNIDYTDINGYAEVDEYIVKVGNETGAIEKAFVTHNAEVKNEDDIIQTAENITITLPDTQTLTTSNQTTVTVADKDDKPVKDLSVTIKDKNIEKSGMTNSSGQVTLPVKSTGGGSTGGGGSSSGGGGGWSSSYNTVNIKITDKAGKSVTGFSKSTDSKGNVIITLPTSKTLDQGNWYTVTVTDRSGKAQADTVVTLKDKNKQEATGKTNAEGEVVLPAKEHTAYIVGYDDSTFRPDSDMTRAEAAAIFARLIAEEKGENISGKSTFQDIDNNAWYANYIGCLAKYNIIKGYSDGTFKPEAPVTRTEFVAMAVRYYDLFHDVTKTGHKVNYIDVAANYWAYADIAFAKNIGWLNGYSDGSFRGDNNITRAEVVAVTNRATGRTADKEYVKDNFTKLNRFADVTDSSLWYFYDVNEAANTHKAVSSNDGEIWVK